MKPRRRSVPTNSTPVTFFDRLRVLCECGSRSCWDSSPDDSEANQLRCRLLPNIKDEDVPVPSARFSNSAVEIQRVSWLLVLACTRRFTSFEVPQLSLWPFARLRSKVYVEEFVSWCSVLNSHAVLYLDIKVLWENALRRSAPGASALQFRAQPLAASCRRRRRRSREVCNRKKSALDMNVRALGRATHLSSSHAHGWNPCMRLLSTEPEFVPVICRLFGDGVVGGWCTTQSSLGSIGNGK